MNDHSATFPETIAPAGIERYASDFDQDGFIRVRKLYPPQDVVRLRAAIDQYVRDVLPKLPSIDYVMEADGRSPRNLWRMHQHDPFFQALPERPDLQRLVARLVHGEPVVSAVETFSKPARIGSAIPPHQDNAYFCQAPPDMLTVWIAIDAATEANGPITYVAGSHQWGLLPHQPSGVRGNSLGLVELPPTNPTRQFVGLLEPGDALIHHCQTVHFSAPNPSPKSRLGLLFVMRGAHTQTDLKLKAVYEKVRPKA